MRKPVAFLFENKVFSLGNPNTYGAESVFDQDIVQREGNFFFQTDPFYHERPYLLWHYDEMETYWYEQRLRRMRTSRYDLACAKKLIVDDTIPAFTKFWFDKDEYAIFDLSIEGGRRELLNLIAECRYAEAIPELREVALHDNSGRLREAAIRTLCSMGREKADPVLNEILGKTHDRNIIEHMTMCIKGSSLNALYVPNLFKKYEEYYDDLPEHPLAIKYFHSIPQAIILLCSHIASVDAYKLIEEGMRHKYAHVRSNAELAAQQWLYAVRVSGSYDPALLRTYFEVHAKYGRPSKVEIII